jgi:hypothetical protein
MLQIRPVYSLEDKRAAKDLAAGLNFVRKKRPERYAELVPIIADLNDVATGRAIAYNEFRDRKEETLFRKYHRRDYSLVVEGKDGSFRIFASDPKYVPELAITRLNARLRDKNTFPEVEAPRSRGKLKVNWRSTSGIGSRVHEILELAERGLLVRVRQCERCGDWFYAKQDRTRFCKKTCAKLYWQSSETGKAKRRKYIRKYMRKYRKKQA